MSKSRRRKRKIKNKNKNKRKISLILLVLIVIAFGAGLEKTDNDNFNNYSSGDAYIHFIDVGQGSSTLIQVGNKGILIDGGERDYGDYVSDYINSCGIDTISLVVASHPHSDHIGGLLDVIDDYQIDKVLMPELTDINMPSTKVYEDLLDSIVEKELTVSVAEVGDKYSMEGVKLEIFGPVEQFDDLNDMSIICKATVNGTEFMILADAEKPALSASYSELNYKADFSSDVIVMGHHGSSTSVYNSFLNAVDADVAVISCGRDNSYGHPHEEALNYIEENSMTLYRTDYEGDIVFKCTESGYERVES